MVFGLTKTWLKGWDASKYGFLNPVFEPNMLHQYDLSYGYQAHHIRCIKENPKGTEAPFDLLNLKGLDVRRVLAPDHAAKLAARARQADRTIHLGDDLTAEEVEETLSAVFSPEIHALLNRYFLTEFVCIFFALSVTKPLENPENPEKTNASFGWHCDGGPTKHLKIMVYLNPAEEHDGATDFLDSIMTGLFKKIGYVFCPVDRRLTDLGELAAQYDLPYAPLRLQPDAGEAVIFEPAGTLHKGICPTRGERCLLTMILIPSAAPWQTFFHRNQEILVRNTGAGFPKLT